MIHLRVFVQALARVWFDFDTLACFRTRPLKSWGRAKRTIAATTQALTAACEEFLRQHAHQQDNAVAFAAMLTRLGLRPAGGSAGERE